MGFGDGEVVGGRGGGEDWEEGGVWGKGLLCACKLYFLRVQHPPFHYWLEGGGASLEKR